MSKRNLVAALLLVVLPASLVACGGDDESGDDTTTTTEAEAPDGTTDGDDAAPDTSEPELTPEDDRLEFGDGVKEAAEKVEAAEDLCAIWEVNAFLATVQPPQSKDEVKAAVQVTADMWRKMADTMPEEGSAEADILRRLAEDFSKGAADVDYDFEAVSGLESIDSQEAQAAQQKFAEIAGAQCRQDSAPSDG